MRYYNLSGRGNMSNYWLGSETLDSFLKDYVEPKELEKIAESSEVLASEDEDVEDESLDPVPDDMSVVSGQECIAEVIKQLEDIEAYAEQQYSNETVKYLMEVTISDLKKMAGLE